MDAVRRRPATGSGGHEPGQQVFVGGVHQRRVRRLGGLDPGELPKTVSNMGISSRPSGMMALLSSHPPIEDRIRALQQAV